MNKKEREICEFEMNFKKYFVCGLIEVDDIISSKKEEGQVSKRVWKVTLFSLI